MLLVKKAKIEGEETREGGSKGRRERSSGKEDVDEEKTDKPDSHLIQEPRF